MKKKFRLVKNFKIVKRSCSINRYYRVIKNKYLIILSFVKKIPPKNISPDLVQSGKFGYPVRQDLSCKFGCPVLYGQETHIPSLIEPYPPPPQDFQTFLRPCSRIVSLVSLAQKLQLQLLRDTFDKTTSIQTC